MLKLDVTKPLMVYLDMNMWVNLTVEVIRGNKPWTQVRTALQDSVDEGKIVIPLSASNYLELWHRLGQQSREDVGASMRDLSKYMTISPTFEVRRQEVKNQVLRFFGKDVTPLSGANLLGQGASHAFRSPYGRFRFVESLASPNGEIKEGPAVEPPEIWKKSSLSGSKWEWLQLVGTQEILENSGVDRTPEHRIGSWYELEEKQLRYRLQNDPEMYNRLKDLVVAQEIDALIEEINETCNEIREDPHALFLRKSGEPSSQAKMHKFIEDLPSSNTWANFRIMKHRDFTHPWDQHDWTDLSSLSVAIPYFDAVFTEKRWANLCRTSGLSRKYKTVTGSRITDLEQFLESLNNRS